MWLLFENADELAKPMFVIFKAGDDLRQDVLTLQVIRLMDKIWQSEGLDLQLRPYACVSTGDDIGMLEVVLDAETTSQISQVCCRLWNTFSSNIRSFFPLIYIMI